MENFYRIKENGSGVIEHKNVKYNINGPII